MNGLFQLTYLWMFGKILQEISMATLLILGVNFLNKHTRRSQKEKVYKPAYSLLGDVGGTNIRLSLVLIQPPSDEPLETIKKAKIYVKDEASFEEAIRKFLSDIPDDQYPEVASIAIAGPVMSNSVSLANVRKWGSLNGEELAKNLQIRKFVFLNDFTANSYGLLLMKPDNFISLNGFDINDHEIRGVIGPGTGLGNSVIYKAPFRNRTRIYILPSEGGHTDVGYVDDETLDYIKFFQRTQNETYICLEKAFCGPSLPIMFQYFASKNPTLPDADLIPKSEEIVQRYLQQASQNSLYTKTMELFFKLYGNAIGNFLANHMCLGGVYLVGSLTASLAEKMKGRDLLAGYKVRHPVTYEFIKQVPIVVSKQVDLGLKGAYVYARRVISDQQHE